MRVIATVEARMTSTRLPRKTMLPLLGKPVLYRVVERIRGSHRVEEVVVATTTNPDDDVIVDHCRGEAIAHYRGSEEDVLGRVIEAARAYDGDLIVQLGADCPFYDPALIDHLVDIYMDGGYDYVTNDIELTYPEGVDAHVVSRQTLEGAARKTTRPRDRDDVPRYVFEHPKDYRIFNLRAPAELYAPDVRLTLDYAEDFTLTEAIYTGLYPYNSEFTTTDVLRFLQERPHLKSINAHCKQLSAPYVRYGQEG